MAPRPTATPTAGNPARPELSRLEIRLGRLRTNLQRIRALLRSTPGGATPALCGVVKKNAYGLGAGPVAHELARAGVDMLAVYSPDEAAELIQQAITAPILVFMPVDDVARTDVLYRHAVAGKLHLSVHEPAQLDALEALGRRYGLRLPVHLHLDTGMSRSGLSPEQFPAALAAARDGRYVRLAGVYSHLAAAEEDPELTEVQRQRFEAALAEAGPLPEGAVRHLANTFGTLRDRRLHLDLVRPGLGLLGYGPELMNSAPAMDGELRLEPAVRWVSRLIHVQDYPAGALVGYGATHRLARPSVLGVVPVGYGDGYPLALGNRASVRVNADQAAHDAAVLGRVNMDQIVVDLTDGLFGAAERLRGAEVELIADHPDAPHALPRLAELAGSNCYELLCRLSTAVPRRYVR